MGISGLWEELAPAAERHGTHVSVIGLILALVKLAAESWQTGRPLTIAIDAAIWSFQVQSGKEGSNPALRTYYYRLCRLLQANIRPIFVFDGPQKPPFKRNQRTSAGNGNNWEVRQVKLLIEAFGFVCWDAPGEAEAECAALQKHGVADLIITEDVDTIMFGAVKMAREIPDGKKRTHLNVYENVESKIGLDRDGLVLIAMMRGTDHLPEGIPGIGPKIASEVGTCLLSTNCIRLQELDLVRH
jgi:holliday junction resolvase YEN1